jgi:uncharacterized membrane protein (UPF0127 family)
VAPSAVRPVPPVRLRARNLDRDAVLAAPLESAESLWTRFRGLMGRATLPQGTGLWLTGSNGIHMMFMRFPIDCVFVGRPDERGARPVLAVRRALPPWRGVVWFVRGADGTLELPVGTLDRTGTRVGDRIVLEDELRT